MMCEKILMSKQNLNLLDVTQNKNGVIRIFLRGVSGERFSIVAPQNHRNRELSILTFERQPCKMVGELFACLTILWGRHLKV